MGKKNIKKIGILGICLFTASFGLESLFSLSNYILFDILILLIGILVLIGVVIEWLKLTKE